jgi:hypothetical protein
MELDHACAELGPGHATMTDLLGVSFTSPEVLTQIGTCTIDEDSPTPLLPSVGRTVPEVRVTIEPPALGVMPMSATLNREALILRVPVLLTPTALSLFWRWRDMLVASPNSLTCFDPARAIHGFFESSSVDIVLNTRDALRAERLIAKGAPLTLNHYMVLVMGVVIRFGVPVAPSWRRFYKRRVADSWFVCASLHSGIGRPVYLDSITLRDLTVPNIAPDIGAVPPCDPCEDSPDSALSRYTDPARHALSVAVLTPIIGAESAEFLVSMHDTLCVVAQEHGDGTI